MAGKRDTAEQAGATPGADADTDDVDPFTDDDVTTILDDAWEKVTE